MKTSIFTALVASLMISPVMAETTSSQNGGDLFIAGDTVLESPNAARDLFVSGRAVSAGGTAAGDVHVVGFSVDVSTKSGADLYAAGGNVTVGAAVGEDLLAVGMTVTTHEAAEVAGNARLAGETIIVEGPISGALSAVGRTVTLNAPVKGDVLITAHTLNLGPEARILGTLSYSAKDQIKVPDEVLSEDRVTYRGQGFDGRWDEIRDEWKEDEFRVLPTAMSLFSGFLITLIFFLLISAIFLHFLPKPVERMRQRIASAPGTSVLLGIIGLSILFGLVPITAMTIVGLPFVPVALLLILVGWALGYLLGAYAIGMRLWAAFGGNEDLSIPMRLLVIAAAITVIAILNFIPFVGWVVNFTLVLLGIGAMLYAILNRMIGNVGPALDVDMRPKETE